MMILKCSTNDLPICSTNVELRKIVFNYYQKNFTKPLKTVINIETGIIIGFERGGANKTAFGGSMYAKKAALITILDQICQHGQLRSVGKPKETDIPKGILCFLNFTANVIIDNQLEIVRFSVRVKKDGSFHYHIDTPLVIKK
ncbi:MAG: hypothetical protein LBU91_05825 [Bacteroidales bacterium]|jgi:hypothetical protein|nr:hypothetical protein [Bacteroidales bacterium]